MTLNLLLNPSPIDATAPMRVLLVGDYGGKPWQKIDINLLAFDSALVTLSPSVEITLAGQSESLVFQCLEDFSPEFFSQNNVRFLALKRAMRCLRQFAVGQTSSLDYSQLDGFVDWIAPFQPNGDQIWMQYNALRDQLSHWIDQVLAYEPFQKLARNWLQLAQLLTALKHDQRKADRRQTHCTVTLLNASNELMLEDLDSVSHSSSSLLFDTIYSTELGQYGGIPYHVVSLQSPVMNNEADLRLLTGLAEIASVAQCVVSATVAYDFYHDVTLADDPLSQPRFVEWQHMVERFESRYLLLSAGHYAVRPLYQYQALDKGLGYEERSGQLLLGTLHIWHLYEFALAHLMAGTALSSAQCVDLTDLLKDKQTSLYIEPSLNPERRQILADLGINCHVANEHFIGFSPRFQLSAARASLAGAVGIELLDKHCELLLLQNQFARYLKMSIRESLGHSSPEAVTHYIQKWLQPFVQSGGLVSRSQAQRQPLSKAELTWAQDSRGGDVLSISLVANLPEYQQPVSLSLAWSGV